MRGKDDQQGSVFNYVCAEERIPASDFVAPRKGIGQYGNAPKEPTPYPLFAKRWFSDEVIILCVRWYLHFQLSYRDLAEIAWELGVLVAPSTILRWVVRYAIEFERCWRKFELRVGRSWRADETYIKVRGKWMYLYRAVDERGRTVESYLSRTRDITAAKAFFRKAA